MFILVFLSFYPIVDLSGPKRVRFLEDGTGNLHTSIFGGSAESIGSLLDSHEELREQQQRQQQQQQQTDDIDSLISSLIAYSETVDRRQHQPPAANGHVDLRKVTIPASFVHRVVNGSDPLLRDDVEEQEDDVVQVVDQRQTIVHLEPDDPNSIDSGSVLSELDFEETSSTITDIDSSKTLNLSSPDDQR